MNTQEVIVANTHLSKLTWSRLQHVFGFLQTINKDFIGWTPKREMGDGYIREIGGETDSDRYNRQNNNIDTLQMLLTHYGWHLEYITSPSGRKVGVSFSELDDLFPAPDEHQDQDQVDSMIYQKLYGLAARTVLFGVYNNIRLDWRCLDETDWRLVDLRMKRYLK